MKLSTPFFKKMLEEILRRPDVVNKLLGAVDDLAEVQKSSNWKRYEKCKLGNSQCNPDFHVSLTGDRLTWEFGYDDPWAYANFMNPDLVNKILQDGSSSSCIARRFGFQDSEPLFEVVTNPEDAEIVYWILSQGD